MTYKPQANEEVIIDPHSNENAVWAKVISFNEGTGMAQVEGSRGEQPQRPEYHINEFLISTDPDQEKLLQEYLEGVEAAENDRLEQSLLDESASN